jgi:hypothetical protein
MHVYLEDTCTTTPVVYAGPLDCDSTSVDAYAISVGDTAPVNACAPAPTIYRTGTPVSNAELGSFWLKSSDTCVAATAPPAVYAPLTALDPTEFVAGQIVTD